MATSNPEIARQLEETGGFKDVPVTLLTSGIPGIYYVNTEALARDGGEFKEYEDDAGAMYKHTIALLDKHPQFRKVIDILATKVKELLPANNGVVSGGQTRDWLFSGPVAHVLGVPHLSIYKPEKGGRIEAHINGGKRLEDITLAGAQAVHVADLITQGSSFYEEIGEKPQGWIPLLQQAGLTIKDAVIVTTRLQGGEELLKSRGVTAHTFVKIDESYLREHSKNAEQATAYFRGPIEWSKKFLQEHGPKAFAKFFDPSGGKLDRATPFLQEFGPHLQAIGRMQELEELTTVHYHLTPQAIVRGERRYSPGNTFADKWRVAMERKGILCVGLDAAEYWQRPEKTMPEGANMLEWCLDIVDKVAPFAAAIKPNRKFVTKLSRAERRALTDRIHSFGMLVIDDEKLPDIGDTNDSGVYQTDMEGYDAVTYSPFPGNIDEAALQAHLRGQGIISMCIMSNKQYYREKRKWVDVSGDKGYREQDIKLIDDIPHVRQYIQLAHDAAVHGVDAIVIGAPSRKNRITPEEIETVKAYSRPDTLILMPGVGTQGGDAKHLLNVFGDRVIANVGSAIIYASNPAAEAEKYATMLNALRTK